MKERSKDLKDATVLKMLRREYPASKYTWMPAFLEIKDKLPHRRYEPSGSTDQASAASVDREGKLGPCSLLEPENWATLEIVVRVVQTELFSKTKCRYSLLAIRDRLRSKVVNLLCVNN
jgi:hypothetical protein